MINEKDQVQLKEKGISEDQVRHQLEQHTKGFPFADIQRPAHPGDGILVIPQQDETVYLAIYHNALKEGLKVCKFVPASGAATRMFKDLFGLLEEPQNMHERIQQSPFQTFFDRLKDFAFYKDLAPLLASKDQQDVIETLLLEKGLNYGHLPKGLLNFHRYNQEAKTPVEEHFFEASQYGKNKQEEAHIHFTVSQEHESLFKQLIARIQPTMENDLKVRFKVSFSNQKSSTDTIAATLDNQPFRTEDGALLFRPGGHGALIENLNDLNSDLVFIKNIDNVVPQHLCAPTILYKQLLAGVLLKYRHEVFDILNSMEKGEKLESTIQRGFHFIETALKQTIDSNVKNGDLKDQLNFIKNVLNRPMRVCGMVKNEGEPGGGPFWVRNEDGSTTLQIVEGAQIDSKDESKMKILAESSHFNPVDLVCSIRDYQGQFFNLLEYVDESTGFISEKSLGGKKLKALELPGLWNGAMARWLTFFVEVPITTFNPVKTVFDLLRPQHQPK
jgi:hypothetical protein